MNRTPAALMRVMGSSPSHNGLNQPIGTETTSAQFDSSCSANSVPDFHATSPGTLLVKHG
jgi:hypothetical protein